jgi:hypothetical protein
VGQALLPKHWHVIAFFIDMAIFALVYFELMLQRFKLAVLKAES